MKLIRILRENWIWWLVPLVVTFVFTLLITHNRDPGEPVMPLTYDLPTTE